MRTDQSNCRRDGQHQPVSRTADDHERDPESAAQVKIFFRARRTRSPGAGLISVAPVTDTSLPDMRTHGPDERGGDGRQRRRDHYLPSAQVLAELAVLGPDLARLAADLQDRLSDQASKPAT
jgi:hypothetical protein